MEKIAMTMNDERNRNTPFDEFINLYGFDTRWKLAKRMAERSSQSNADQDISNQIRNYLNTFDRIASGGDCKFKTAYQIIQELRCPAEELGGIMFPTLNSYPQPDFRFLDRQIDAELMENGSKKWKEVLRVEVLAEELCSLKNVAQSRVSGEEVNGESGTPGFRMFKSRRSETTWRDYFDVICPHAYCKGDIIEGLTLNRTCDWVHGDDRWFTATHVRIPTDLLTIQYRLPKREQPYKGYFLEYRNLSCYEMGRPVSHEEIDWNEEINGFARTIELPMLDHWYKIHVY